MKSLKEYIFEQNFGSDDNFIISERAQRLYESRMQYLDEKLKISSDVEYLVRPADFGELKYYVNQKWRKYGAGTAKNPVPFNNIDVSEITEFYDKDFERGLFQNMKFEYIDLSNWNVSKITTMNRMFCKCGTLKKIIGIENWKPESVKDLSFMFARCFDLESIDFKNWKTPKLENMRRMFVRCKALETVRNFDKLDVSYVIKFDGLFGLCSNLKSVGDLSNWNVTNNCTSLKEMFFDCERLKDIGDISKWNVRKVTHIEYMFANCVSIKSLGELDNWNINHLVAKKYALHAFTGCCKLKGLPRWYQQRARIWQTRKIHIPGDF